MVVGEGEKKLKKQICLLLKEENKVNKKTEYKRSDCYLKCLFHTVNNLQIITWQQQHTIATTL